MGQDVERREFTGTDRQRYREKLRACVAVLRGMLDGRDLDVERPLTGLEIELNLVDDDALPVMRNDEVLEAIGDPAFQTELGQFTIEINVPPRSLTAHGAAEFEEDVRSTLDAAETKAQLAGAHIVMVGILPTLAEADVTAESMSTNPRYALLNDQIVAARGEDVRLAIDGVESLACYADSIAPEAACTSVQLHLQVSPADFAPYWNAAQAIAGVQLALGANSPFLFGRELWRETRIALFEQATDTRTEELISQGVRPRVWFGERWIDSVADLFEENARYFPALLPICEDEDPAAVIAAGGVPGLAELRLHNGTIYRWNRPVYDVADGRPHLRIENRVLPAGPTVTDVLANAAFFYGLVRFLVDAPEPVWRQLSFSAAEQNFHAAARHGIDATLFWPGIGSVPAADLVLDVLLPAAREGLRGWDVDDSVAERLVDVIAGRCRARTNGAAWQVSAVRAAEEAGASRTEALCEMTHRYIEHMSAGRPVHEWPAA